ncbi:hypothetical protein [Mycolicibacterium fortuitum]|uniref:hypothetical protein n=1 Tax=Mycolicibacterium fortuitum TaxID=1766 RepID=UPI0013F4F9EA|nr:hypothetical protein [Mycolicibacterium fortuitum]
MFGEAGLVVPVPVSGGEVGQGESDVGDQCADDGAVVVGEEVFGLVEQGGDDVFECA